MCVPIVIAAIANFQVFNSMIFEVMKIMCMDFIKEENLMFC
jgi:hypothetical protein